MTQNYQQQSSSQLYWVAENVISTEFPPVDSALRSPAGLLAIGGDLDEERLLSAYQQGIFPWYNHGQPVMWWSPDPRCVFEPDNIHISRSLCKTLRKKKFTVTLNKDFARVIGGCAAPRIDHDETWISHDIIQAYTSLHRNGYAHSVECWIDEQLAGGLYGVAIDKIFFGESMFSRVSDASKVALIHLARFLSSQSFRLIDCQIYSDHLARLGAKKISRKQFCQVLKKQSAELKPHYWPGQYLNYE